MHHVSIFPGKIIYSETWQVNSIIVRVIDILIARYAHMANYTVIMYEEEYIVTSKSKTIH